MFAGKTFLFCFLFKKLMILKYMPSDIISKSREDISCTFIRILSPVIQDCHLKPYQFTALNHFRFLFASFKHFLCPCDGLKEGYKYFLFSKDILCLVFMLVLLGGFYYFTHFTDQETRTRQAKYFISGNAIFDKAGVKIHVSLSPRC